MTTLADLLLETELSVLVLGDDALGAVVGGYFGLLLEHYVDGLIEIYSLFHKVLR